MVTIGVAVIEYHKISQANAHQVAADILSTLTKNMTDMQLVTKVAKLQVLHKHPNWFIST